MRDNSIEKKDNKIIGKSAFVRWFLRALIFVVVIVTAGIGVFIFLGGVSSSFDGSDEKTGFFTAVRGDLTISVTESGDIKAINSEDIKSEVEGRTTIISIVDEGTYITLEDVNNGKILVELDSSEIEQKLMQQKVTFLKWKCVDDRNFLRKTAKRSPTK